MVEAESWLLYKIAMSARTTTLATAEGPDSQKSQNGLALVERPVDHHPDAAMIKELTEALAANDRNRILEFATRLITDADVLAKPTRTVEDKWLTPAEAAQYANISRMTVWRWRNERGLAFTKVGGVVRIRRSELQKFLEQHMSG